MKEDGNWTHTRVPYLLVNCVFRCAPGYYRDKALGRSCDYRQVLVTGSPEEEEAAFQAELAEGVTSLEDWVNRVNMSEPKPKVWTYDDPLWHHLEKFDAFWFREWVADCPVTRAALQELRLYQIDGRTGSVYRTTDEEIVLKHLETLQMYWD